MGPRTDNVQTSTSTTSPMLYPGCLFNSSNSTFPNNTFQPKEDLAVNEIPIQFPIST